MKSGVSILLVLMISPAGFGAERVSASPPTPEQVQACVDRAVQYLLREQNPDGSWGSHRNALPGYDDMFSSSETHRAWTVATTGICCMALLEMPQTDETCRAYDRGIDFVLQNAALKRPSDWDTDHTWGLLYGLQTLAKAYVNPREAGSERRERMRDVGQRLIGELARYQTPSHGWGYYDFEGPYQRPIWATSFMTALGVLALCDAQDAGFDVDHDMLRRAVQAVRRCRLPNGAFTYSVRAIPTPRGAEAINQIKGSLSRIQVCNLALSRAGDPIPREQLVDGLTHFFKEHKFLDVARQKPIPHEAFYYNSGYFYFFGHCYAAGVIERLPPKDQAIWWPKLQREIVKTQESDGAMWDYHMNSYGKPYGVAFSLLALAPSLAESVEVESGQ